MSAPVIRVEKLSKLYRLGKKEERPPTLIQSVGQFLGSPVRNFRKLRSLTNFSDAANSPDVLWALRDVSFEVQQGDVVGLIGRNGAGKSTLLKILSRIMPPSLGKVEIRGRLASLLEVGTGFHPELTGRDNVFLNGAILGMTRKEIARKFDEIVAFSEIEKFIDTPVKRYSSGMYVRLAFAVAAHLEPDILLVDEVLAVGDAAFQKKCLGKIKDVSGQGRTIIFVSHNMSAVSSLCTKAVLFEKGRGSGVIPVNEAVTRYLEEDAVAVSKSLVWEGAVGDETLKLHRLAVKSGDDSIVLRTHTDILVEFEFETLEPLEDVVIGLFLESVNGQLLAVSAQYDDVPRKLPTTLAKGKHRFRVTLPANTLAQGTYKAVPNIGVHNRRQIVGLPACVQFTTVNTHGLGLHFLTGSGQESIFRPAWHWEKQ
jgi:lipopolysaccharide transport system ATP-binding protein